MNTPATTPAPDAAPATSEPSHVTAKRELDALFATLGLTAEVSGAHAAIDPESGHEGKGWAHVALTVTFTRQQQDNGHGRKVGAAPFAASFPYRMGVGLVDWKAIATKTGWQKGPTAKRDAEAMGAYGSRLTVEAQRRIAGEHVGAFVKRVSPAEVLACACRDGEDASGQSFADWAANYGYDEDSRKALATYEACQQAGDKARRLVAHVPGAFAKLAALSCEL